MLFTKFNAGEKMNIVVVAPSKSEPKLQIGKYLITFVIAARVEIKTAQLPPVIKSSLDGVVIQDA